MTWWSPRPPLPACRSTTPAPGTSRIDLMLTRFGRCAPAPEPSRLPASLLVHTPGAQLCGPLRGLGVAVLGARIELGLPGPRSVFELGDSGLRGIQVVFQLDDPSGSVQRQPLVEQRPH